MMRSVGKGMLVVSVLLAAGCAAFGTSSHLEATIDLEGRRITGTEEVAFDPSARTAYFLLLANFDLEENPFLAERVMDERYPFGFEPGETVIEKVELVQSGSSTALPFRLLATPPALQTYSLEETALAVDLPGVAAGEARLRISFVTSVPRRTDGDQGLDRGILTWRFAWFPLLLPSEAGWREEQGVLLPRSGSSLPLDFPAVDYSARLSAPEDVVLAVGADHLEEEGRAEGRTTYRAWSDGPTRTVALVAGTGYERYVLDGEIPIEVLYLAGHEEAARLLATLARDVLVDYGERYGPCPRTRLVIVENPNRTGLCMTADGIVLLSSLLFTHRNVTLPGILDRVLEFALAHEIAHLWWGIGIGVDLNAENWLSEGLSQYLSITYFEGRHGEFTGNLIVPAGKGILENVVQSQFGFLNLREHEVEYPYLRAVFQGFDEAIVKPLVEVEYENATVVRLYDKGYLAARAVAAAVGREAFEVGLREAAARFAGGTIRVLDLERILEEVSGKDLAEVFRVLLFEENPVDYAVRILARDRAGDRRRTTVRVTREGGAAQPVVVEATLRSGETVRQEWDGSAEAAEIVFETDEMVRRVTIDPDHLLPDRDRLNNNDPVKIVAVTTGNAFPLDGIVLRPNALSQGLTVSYLDRYRVSVGKGTLAADVVQGREHQLSLWGTLSEEGLAAGAAYTFTAFAQPEVGSPGTYWEEASTLTLAGFSVPTEDGSLAFVRVVAALLPSVTRSRATSFGLDLTPSGAGRIAIAAFDEVRLVPLFYLQGTLGLGMGFGDVPEALWFELPELKSFGKIVGGRWVPARFRGTDRLYARLALEVPAGSGEPYNLANLLMLDDVRGRVYLAVGSAWTGLEEWGRTLPSVEVGVEASLDLSALGGLLGLRVTLGYAAPVLGEGAGILYFGLGS